MLSKTKTWYEYLTIAPQVFKENTFPKCISKIMHKGPKVFLHDSDTVCTAALHC